MRRFLLLSAICCLALAPAARADYDPVGSGQTKLALDRGFLKLLRQNGATVSAVAPARLTGNTATFPVSGGKLDPVSSKGTIEHEGALVFKANGRSLPLKSLQLKTTSKATPFSAKAGGGQLKLATAQGLSVARQGFGGTVKVQGLSLSAKLATRLAKKLKLRGVAKAGLPFASSLTTANPQTITVLGKGKASLDLDPGFLAKLNSLFVAVNPVFPAEHPGPFTFAIFGGTIAPDGSQGTLEAQGALEFIQLGGGQVFWKEPWVDLAAKALSAEAEALPSPPYGGKAGRVTAAPLSGGSASADPKARTVTVSNLGLALDAAMAATFNDVFAKPQGKSGVFSAGEAVGALGFVAQGQ